MISLSRDYYDEYAFVCSNNSLIQTNKGNEYMIINVQMADITCIIYRDWFSAFKTNRDAAMWIYDD